MEKQLAGLVNETSRESDSDTPDFVLAEFMMASLDAFEVAVNKREAWYGRPHDAASDAMRSERKTFDRLKWKVEALGMLDPKRDNSDGASLMRELLEALDNATRLAAVDETCAAGRDGGKV